VSDASTPQAWAVPSVGGDVLLRIRGATPRLSRTALLVAQQVLDDPAVVVASSISELADLCGVSQASVTRFCQSLGLAGYPDLKFRIAAELGRSPEASWSHDVGAEIEASDPPERIAAILAATDVRALQQTLEQLDTKAIAQAAEAITLANRIDVFGVGGSALIASELQLRLHRIGRPIWACSDSHVALMSAALHRPGDVFFAVSRSGRTVEVVEATAEAHARGSTAVALTSFPGSPLAAASDIVVTTHVEDIEVRHGSLAARYAQLLVADTIYSVVAQQTFARSAEALAQTASALVSHRRMPAVRRRRDGRR
jgi:DNA-binding MurR/RpiR family transcriptional regulator